MKKMLMLVLLSGCLVPGGSAEVRMNQSLIRGRQEKNVSASFGESEGLPIMQIDYNVQLHKHSALVLSLGARMQPEDSRTDLYGDLSLLLSGDEHGYVGVFVRAIDTSVLYGNCVGVKF